MTTPSSVAIPTNAMKPTQTATLRVDRLNLKQLPQMHAEDGHVAEPLGRVEANENHPARAGDENAGPDQQRRKHRSELQVEQHKDQQQCQRDDDRQRLRAADLILVAADERRFLDAGG